MPFHDSATDETKMTEFFQYAALPLYKYAMLLLEDHDLAQDAVQNTFTALVRYYDQVRDFEQERLLRYAKRILEHECGFVGKQQDSLVLTQDLAVEDPQAEEPFIDFVERKVTREEVRRCIRKMMPRYRKVLHMRYFENRSNEELAAELNLPVNSTRTVLTRARMQLKKIYQEEILDREEKTARGAKK